MVVYNECGGLSIGGFQMNNANNRVIFLAFKVFIVSTLNAVYPMARSEQLKSQCIAAFHCHAFKKKTILENSPFFKSKITDTFENINISF